MNLRWWSLLVLDYLFVSCSRCEGGSLTWDGSRPVMLPIPAELTGNQPGYGPLLKKRSYKRALKRAQRDGGTWYRNTWITSATYAPDEPRQKTNAFRCAAKRPLPRLTLLSWNTWSLTMELWREIQDYAVQHSFDLLFLQSTCWSFDSSWTTSHYHVIHCGHATDRHCGILLMVSKKLCSPQEISHCTVIDGRVQHVRIKLKDHGVDLLNVYQHPWRSTDSQETNIANRDTVWKALHQSLSQVPFRNQLLIAGDFNASLLHASNPDDEQFRQLVRHHHLGSLLQSKPTQCTYFAPQGKSQIDYVFSRQCQLDAKAKQGWVDLNNPLGSWRTSLDHRPLISSFPKQWHPWRRTPPAIASARQVREHLANMQRHHPDHWSQLCDQIGNQISSKPQTLEQIESLHTSIIPSLPLVRPQMPSTSGLASGGLTKQLWQNHKILLRPRLTNMQSLFGKWQTWTKVCALRKILRKQCRQTKRQKLAMQIQAAAQAFREKDPYRMYKIINQLAPKAPYRQVHLRSKTGLAQDPAQELQEITAFFRQLCDQSTWTFEAPPLDAMPFTQAELERALLRTPKTKSVAPKTSPGHIIAGLAPTLAPWLFGALHTLWTQNATLTIPHLWQDAWISCLPKRSVTSPKDLRPIALQCAIGKAVLRVIVRKAMAETHAQFVPWPLFAYLRGRSTEHALLRVHQHLRDVRDQCKSLTHTIWNRHAQQSQPRCHGGLTLSLDLSNAFDCVDRGHLAQGMEVVHLSTPLRNLLLSWLCPVHYHLQHKGLSSSIPVTRGIRQGCVASPFLWLLWSMAFLRDLEACRSYEWICKHLSIYADDFISQWAIQTLEDFTQALTDIGLLLDLLDDFRLQVSLSKSVVLMKLVGTSCRKLHKRHCCWVHGQYCLKIPRRNGQDSFLPIVKSHKYLGSILTYVNPEGATLTYRLKCGKLAFFRLIKFLGKTGQCSKAFKLRLWQQCIICSYVYALFPCGLTRTGCYRFESTMFQDMRRLANNWSHITHVSNLELATQLKVEPPLDLLQVRWQEHADRHAHAGEMLHPFDLIRSLDISGHWHSLYIQIASATCDRPNASAPDTSSVWTCPHCPKTFHLRAVLRRHIVAIHPDLDDRPNFVITRDAKHGMPQCRHCNRKLSSRFNLKLHIEQQWCTSFDPNLQEIEPLSAQPSVRHRILEGHWNTLLADRGLCRELAHHCCLCQTWCAQTKSLAAHLKRDHGELLTASIQHRAEIERHVRWDSICHVCENTVQKTHKCPVVIQLAVLKQHAQDTPAELIPESLCPAPALTKRRSPFDGAYAEDVPPTFDASRDCRGGFDLCVHCGGQFKDHMGLKRHIEYRRCSKFDSSRAPQPWILKFQPALHELFQIVHPESWLYDRDFLLRLKQECVLCGRHFDRAARVATHLEVDWPSLCVARSSTLCWLPPCALPTSWWSVHVWCLASHPWSSTPVCCGHTTWDPQTSRAPEYWPS